MTTDEQARAVADKLAAMRGIKRIKTQLGYRVGYTHEALDVIAKALRAQRAACWREAAKSVKEMDWTYPNASQRDITSVVVRMICDELRAKAAQEEVAHDDQ